MIDAKAVADKYISRTGAPPRARAEVPTLTRDELRWLRKAVERRGWLPTQLRDGAFAPTRRECEALQRRGLVNGPPWRIGALGRDAVRRFAAAENDGAPLNPPAVKTLAQIEAEAIRQAIDLCGGNKTLAAKLLGISVRTIRNKLRPKVPLT